MAPYDPVAVANLRSPTAPERATAGRVLRVSFLSRLIPHLNRACFRLCMCRPQGRTARTDNPIGTVAVGVCFDSLAEGTGDRFAASFPIAITAELVFSESAHTAVTL